MRGKAGGLQAAFRRAPLPIDQFEFTQRQQERQMIEVLLRRSGCRLFTLAVHGRQLQLFEMMFYKHGGLGFSLGHRTSSRSKLW